MDFYDAKEEAVTDIFKSLTPDDITPGEIESEEYKSDIVENVAETVYMIETGKDWEEATEGEKQGYLERAEGFVDNGMIIDTDNMEIDIPAKHFSGEIMKESFDPSASDLRKESYEEREETVSSDDFYEEYDNEEVLEELGYEKVGDGLYMSEEDYSNNIQNDDDKDPVCA